MGFLRRLLTGQDYTAEEKKETKDKNKFDTLKYDGIRALSTCGCTVDFAIACLSKALEIKDDAETRAYLAQALMRNGDAPAAIEQYTHLRELQPEEPLYPIMIARLAYQEEDYATMEQACNDAIGIDATLATPHLLLAMKAKAQGDQLQAIVQTTQAIAAKEDYYEAYILRARTLCDMQQYSEAEKDIDIVLQNTELSEETALLKAEICSALDKQDEAEQYFNTTTELDPFQIKAYIGLSALYLRQGKTAEAKQVIEDAMEQNPDTAELHKARGGILLLEGDKAGAAADMKRALELSPEDAHNLTGEFSNKDGKPMQEKVRQAYNMLNPYQFSIQI